MIDLVICVPVRDTVHSRFAYDLANLVSHLSYKNVTHKLIFQNGSILPDQRMQLVKDALKHKPAHILFLDSDMTFVSSVYHELLKHDKPVVACTYITRSAPYKNVAFLDHNNLEIRLSEKSGLHRVASVGMGIMLISSEVFNTVNTPWFAFEYNYMHDGFIGEDIYFCKKIKEYDYDVFVDVDTSNLCGHLASTTMKLRDIYA
jgi:hypothetical protein